MNRQERGLSSDASVPSKARFSSITVVLLVINVIVLTYCLTVVERENTSSQEEIERIVGSRMNERESKLIEYFQKSIFPMYEKMRIDYNKKPKTLEEALEPLFRVIVIDESPRPPR